MHKELDISTMMKRIRESNYFVKSYFLNGTFDQQAIETFRECHYENIVDPDLESDDSLYMEANPNVIGNYEFIVDNVWSDVL
jgi:hypothetical protein